jgi:hypothetical protein
MKTPARWGFIDWERGSITSPPAAETTYTASFYLKREGDDLSLIYVLRYLPDPSGGQGFIYIPGPGDPWYRLNIGTIITGSSDRWDPNGKWQYATAEWDRVVRGALEARGHPAADPAAVTVEGPAPEPAGGADAAPIFLPSR